jgi:hypothetical protein
LTYDVGTLFSPSFCGPLGGYPGEHARTFRFQAPSVGNGCHFTRPATISLGCAPLIELEGGTGWEMVLVFPSVIIERSRRLQIYD